MKKMIFIATILATASLFTACVSVTKVSGKDLSGQKIDPVAKTTIAHINVQNWGIYLFSIPLLTGDTNSVGSIAVLKDTVNLEKTLPVLTNESKNLKATQTLELTSQFTNGGFIFYSRSINISGNAVR